MIETLITIILFPVALGAIIVSGCMVAGVVKYFKEHKRK
jgi:hypothetical protein